MDLNTSTVFSNLHLTHTYVPRLEFSQVLEIFTIYMRGTHFQRTHSPQILLRLITSSFFFTDFHCYYYYKQPEVDAILFIADCSKQDPIETITAQNMLRVSQGKIGVKAQTS